MSVTHTRAAYRLTAGDGITKAVLVALSDHACEACGLAWPGVPLLAERIEYRRTAIQEALRRLEKQGLVHTFAYSTGGRARATVFVVLPGIVELSTAPCPQCVENMKNPPRGGRYPSNGPRGGPYHGEKPTAERAVSEKGPATGIENRPPRGPQPPDNQNHHARAREAAESPTPPAPASPPPAATDGTWSTLPRTGDRELDTLIGDLELKLGPPSQRPTPKDLR